jgi:hypothetical protein
MRETCCEWRSVVEGEFGEIFGFFVLGVECVDFVPILENLFFFFREVGVLGD